MGISCMGREGGTLGEKMIEGGPRLHDASGVFIIFPAVVPEIVEDHFTAFSDESAVRVEETGRKRPSPPDSTRQGGTGTTRQTVRARDRPSPPDSRGGEERRAERIGRDADRSVVGREMWEGRQTEHIGRQGETTKQTVAPRFDETDGPRTNHDVPATTFKNFILGLSLLFPSLCRSSSSKVLTRLVESEGSSNRVSSNLGTKVQRSVGRRTGSSNCSSVSRRIWGRSVVSGRFYVRGLYRERIVNVVVLTIG